ncbi:MAG: hypothetical protein AUJ47_10820 [Candidatus Marinimicrobia bacterium CG1_02_48_14]|nr:MAG: hypothetical protein AUJ47_10820 [Candidatus Marinimicrobia bacterium CG1_02_48_14]PIZ67952.1 MAG: GxxExxY protein [Candidatus Marinimicrobia bacterium CG_4_10_14_0_2_um_filter_48_9]
MTEILYKELSYKVVGCAMEVHKELGPGFLESVYEAAMVVELEKQGIQFALQTQFPVIYKGVLVKHFIADMVIANEIVVELKAISQIGNIEKAQVINYLKATGLKLGLLINFGQTSLQFERIVR